MNSANIRAWKTRAGFALAVFFLVLCGSKLAGEYTAAFDITRKAYRIAQNGHVDTDLQFSECFGDSFTLAAWVMPLLYPQPTQSITWLPVDQDQPLVKLYGPENHLHRSVRHMGDGSEYTPTPSTVLPSIPSAFDNYQRFREDLPQQCNKANASHWQNDDCWIPVLRGMPRKGQVLRRVY